MNFKSPSIVLIVFFPIIFSDIHRFLRLTGIRVFQHLDDSLSEKQSVPACVNAIVWLGLEAYQENWVKSVTSQEAWYSVFGETYENEIRLPVVGWTKDGCPRPNFSNAGGKKKVGLKIVGLILRRSKI